MLAIVALISDNRDQVRSCAARAPQPIAPFFGNLNHPPAFPFPLLSAQRTPSFSCLNASHQSPKNTAMPERTTKPRSPFRPFVAKPRGKSRRCPFRMFPTRTSPPSVFLREAPRRPVPEALVSNALVSMLPIRKHTKRGPVSVVPNSMFPTGFVRFLVDR